MSSNWIRWGGLAGVVAGAMYALTAILSLFAPQEVVFDSITDYLIEVIFVVGLAGTLVVIASLHALQRDSYGRLGAAGSLTAFAGYALLVVAAAATTLAGREVLDAVFPVGVLAILLGSVLLGTMTLRARMLPWWCGVFLIVGFPLTVPLDIAIRGAGGIMLGIVWALIGYALLQRGDAQAHQPARAS
ncbi:MAG: hypothetical protein ACRDSJ_19125 [Rubrobacteraceae bacterium]